MILQRHQRTLNDEYATLIDLLSVDSKGNQTVTETMHIDCLSDLGLPRGAINELQNGQAVTVKFDVTGQ